ncbi:MAG: hypothetical protein R2857_14750 [Vampirovibrionales bacterium]
MFPNPFFNFQANPYNPFMQNGQQQGPMPYQVNTNRQTFSTGGVTVGYNNYALGNNPATALDALNAAAVKTRTRLI